MKKFCLITKEIQYFRYLGIVVYRSSTALNFPEKYTIVFEVDQPRFWPFLTGWEHTGQMLCIVDTSLSVLMTLRMCLCELCCLFTVWI